MVTIAAWNTHTHALICNFFSVFVDEIVHRLRAEGQILAFLEANRRFSSRSVERHTTTTTSTTTTDTTTATIISSATIKCKMRFASKSRKVFFVNDSIWRSRLGSLLPQQHADVSWCCLFVCLTAIDSTQATICTAIVHLLHNLIYKS